MFDCIDKRCLVEPIEEKYRVHGYAEACADIEALKVDELAAAAGRAQRKEDPQPRNGDTARSRNIRIDARNSKPGMELVCKVKLKLDFDSLRASASQASTTSSSSTRSRSPSKCRRDPLDDFIDEAQGTKNLVSFKYHVYS